jgi:hypothetical protein
LIRDTLAASLKKFARRLNFEELHSGMYALRQAYTTKKDKQTSGTLSTAYKQIELDILSSLKESGAKSQNLRVLAERVFVLENSFRGNQDAAELSAEYLGQF